jgi:hypothetical protein
MTRTQAVILSCLKSSDSYHPGRNLSMIREKQLQQLIRKAPL